MKNEWHLQNLIANRTVHEFPRLARVKVRRFKLNSNRYIDQAAVCLMNGDLLIVRICKDRSVELWHYTLKFKFPKKQLLHGDGIPTRVTFAWGLFDSDFATIDNSETESLQTLRVHNTSPNIAYDTSVTFYGKEITFLEAMNITSSHSTIVLGTKVGTIFLVQFSEGMLKLEYQFRTSRDMPFYNLKATKRWMWIEWRDGLITVWDTIAKKQLGNIKNPQQADSQIDEHHLLTCVDGILRVHENKLGLKLKATVKLPLQKELPSDYIFLPLNQTVGVIHNENSEIVFFELMSGRPISRVSTLFKSLHSMQVLADATLILRSNDSSEGITIMRIMKPQIVYDALCEQAKNKYSHTIVEEPKNSITNSMKSLIRISIPIVCCCLAKLFAKK